MFESRAFVAFSKSFLLSFMERLLLLRRWARFLLRLNRDSSRGVPGSLEPCNFKVGARSIIISWLVPWFCFGCGAWSQRQFLKNPESSVLKFWKFDHSSSQILLFLFSDINKRNVAQYYRSYQKKKTHTRSSNLNNVRVQGLAPRWVRGLLTRGNFSILASQISLSWVFYVLQQQVLGFCTAMPSISEFCYAFWKHSALLPFHLLGLR